MLRKGTLTVWVVDPSEFVIIAFGSIKNSVTVLEFRASVQLKKAETNFPLLESTSQPFI
ncbi:hypothetical protein YK48G_06730 [Lentilactobacillus fungorum]|uniref:Uncharacterized protein n=1 Tax=Lentilactobacillus fungorum TaxID=2201250 RepID=A0ABQ3VWH0_9LACO|nr:hypothetical protein YK48G_06730 [Lentilactobacillus fungorum]